MRSPCLLAAILWLGVLPAAPAQEVLVGFEQASGARPPPPWQVVAGRRHRPPSST
ncbi:MAG: hypothetical protein RML12_05140 [Xanthomonadales bacterium]|nr:hypothetical protein [Xanthomonadales bacterium]